LKTKTFPRGWEREGRERGQGGEGEKARATPGAQLA